MKLVMCLAGLLAAGGLYATDTSVVSNSLTANTLATNLPAQSLTNASTLTTNASAASIAAVRSFEVQRGFRVNLVASESLVSQPSAMTFDESGHLFVIESGEGTPSGSSLSRVRLLSDADENGMFHSSSVYAENITNATALACYNGGVFVAAGGEILYLKDSDGNGSADDRRAVFKDFGDTTNGMSGQVIITSLAWGVDDRIHVSTIGRGGDVVSSSSPSQSVILTGGNFSFDPRNLMLAIEGGSRESAIAFDAGGLEYALSLRGHLRTILYQARYAKQNPYFEIPWPVLDLGGFDLPQAKAASASSPTTSPVFTPGGLTIYQGNGFPAEYWGNVFAVNSAANELHRRIIRQQGEQLSAERAANEYGAAFLKIGDPALQLMQAIPAPDGSMYLAVRSRAAIAATPIGKTNAPSTLLARGGIFRLSSATYKPVKLPQMSKASAELLVQLLAYPNGWQRDTAARLLYEREERTAIVPLIRALFDAKVLPLARMRALRALDGIQFTTGTRIAKALLEAHVLQALTDSDERVRVQAIQLSERFITNDSVSGRMWDALSGLAADGSSRVRCQLAFTLGQFNHIGRAQVLGHLVLSDPANRLLQWAALSSLQQGVGEVFVMCAQDTSFCATSGGQEFLRLLIQIVGSRNQQNETVPVLAALPNLADPQLAFDLALALDNSLERVDGSILASDTSRALTPLFNRARTMALDPTVNDATRTAALRLMSRWLPEDELEPSVATLLVRQWSSLSALMRAHVAQFMLSRPRRAALLMFSLGGQTVLTSDLSSSQIRFLCSYPNATVRQLATNLFTAPDSSVRQRVVQNYLPATRMDANAAHGQEIYTMQCAMCHQFVDETDPLRLAFLPGGLSSKEAVLAKILDPNRGMPISHGATLITTKGGETLMGFVIADNPRGVTLGDGTGEVRIIGHSQIISETGLSFSAMNDGVENVLNRQDMADLLEYLCGDSANARDVTAEAGR